MSLSLLCPVPTRRRGGKYKNEPRKPEARILSPDSGHRPTKGRDVEDAVPYGAVRERCAKTRERGFVGRGALTPPLGRGAEENCHQFYGRKTERRTSDTQSRHS